jgi:NAD(P)-dependent dehydrogenase (short-subunit alcohol dehydrogenase family)
MNERTRTTLITGASRGIGRRCAEHLVASGHMIVNLDLNPPEGDFSGDSYTVDLANRSAVREMLAELAGRYEFNGLLNNAGAVGQQSLEEIDLEVFDEVVEVNLVTAIQCAQACLPSMKKQGFGRIVGISSELVLGIALRTAYSGTKAALISFTRTWALELARHGITVNAVAPGPVDTEFFMGNNPIGSPQRESKLRRIAVGRFGDPSDVANVVGFLMQESSEYVTGQTIFVDGGSSLGNALLP